MSMFACFALILNSSAASFLSVMPVIPGLGILFHLLLVDLCASVAKVILELVKMSDLARIRGKSVRARLYYDAGVGTVEKMARCDAKKLRAMLIDFVQKGFDGIASLPDQAEFTVAVARKLPKIVEYREHKKTPWPPNVSNMLSV